MHEGHEHRRVFTPNSSHRVKGRREHESGGSPLCQDYFSMGGTRPASFRESRERNTRQSCRWRSWEREREREREREKEKEKKREMYRMSVKSLCNFKNLLQRQMKRQIGGSYYKMWRIYLSFFFFALVVRLAFLKWLNQFFEKHSCFRSPVFTYVRRNWYTTNVPKPSVKEARKI